MQVVSAVQKGPKRLSVSTSYEDTPQQPPPECASRCSKYLKGVRRRRYFEHTKISYGDISGHHMKFFQIKQFLLFQCIKIMTPSQEPGTRGQLKELKSKEDTQLPYKISYMSKYIYDFTLGIKSQPICRLCALHVCVCI